MEVKKRIIPVFVAALMVFTMMPMMAGSVYADSFYYEEDGLNYKIKETVATCTGVEDENGKAIDRSTGAITIHQWVAFYIRVTKIGKNAFTSLPSGIYKVIIPEGVIDIEEGAFDYNLDLKSVSLPDSLVTIHKNAFRYCANLETVSFTNESKLQTLSYGAFSDCYHLKEVTIPSSVRRIEANAFTQCNALTTVHYGGTRQQWEAIQGDGKPSIDLVEFNYPIPQFNYPISQEIKTNGTSIKDLKSAKKAITVKWKKQAAKVNGSHITGYQIRLATDKKFTKNKKTVTVKGYKIVSKKIKNLKSKKKYYVKIRTYKSVGGEKYYSPWSKSMNVKTR